MYFAYVHVRVLVVEGIMPWSGVHLSCAQADRVRGRPDALLALEVGGCHPGYPICGEARATSRVVRAGVEHRGDGTGRRERESGDGCHALDFQVHNQIETKIKLFRFFPGVSRSIFMLF